MDDIAVRQINRMRRTILVHSYLYYVLDRNIVSDFNYDRWAKLLADMQKKHPKESEAAVYANAFRHYDGSTGFHLPYKRDEIEQAALRLIREHDKKG